MDKDSPQEDIGYRDPADMFRDPAEQRAHDDEQWIEMFRKGIQFIEDTKGVKYDESQIKNFAILLHGKIPPLRFYKICKEILYRKAYRKLPMVEDFLDLHEGEHKLPYVAPGSYHKTQTCEKGCAKGWLRIREVFGIHTIPWIDYFEPDRPEIGTITELDARESMVVCDCAFARYHHKERKPGWIFRCLDDAQIGYRVEGGVIYSERYADRCIRIRLKKQVVIPGVPDRPVLVEFNAECRSGVDDQAEFTDLDDLYTFPLVRKRFPKSEPVVEIDF